MSSFLERNIATPFVPIDQILLSRPLDMYQSQRYHFRGRQPQKRKHNRCLEGGIRFIESSINENMTTKAA
jgi:hypothetical protein